MGSPQEDALVWGNWFRRKTQLRCVAPIIALVWGNLRTESNPTCAQADEKVSGPAERGSGFLNTLNVARLSTSTPRVA